VAGNSVRAASSSGITCILALLPPATRLSTAMTAIRSVLAQGTQRLVQADIPGARFRCSVLLAHALGVERSIFYAYPEREISF